MSSRRQQHRSESGAVAVELALVLPLLVLLVFGIIEFGRGYDAKISLNAAVREGARALALGTGSATSATEAAAPMLDADDITVTTSASPCTPGQPVTVTATYPFTYSVPFFDDGTVTLTSTAVMRCAG